MSLFTFTATRFDVLLQVVGWFACYRPWFVVLRHFFSVQRLHGFRQVVQHVSEYVAIGINELIKSRKGRCCSGRKSKLVEDRYIVLCTVTFIRKTSKTPHKNKRKQTKQKTTQTTEQ